MIKTYKISDLNIITITYKGFKIPILTDDYSIQNLAKHMDIDYQGLAQEEIDEEYEWKYRCTKCRRWHKEPLDECPICGGEVKSARLIR